MLYAVIKEDELKEIAGVKQQGKLLAWLIESGISYKYNAQKKVFTTDEQLNKSFEFQPDSIEFGK